MKFYTKRQERQRKACRQMQKGIKRAQAKGKETDEQETHLRNTWKNSMKGE